MISFEKKQIDQVAIVKFAGELDTNTSPQAADYLMEVLESGKVKILFNFKQLEYMSSAGLRVLLVAAKAVQSKKGAIGICSMNTDVKNVLMMTGLDVIFKIFEDEEEGIAKL